MANNVNISGLNQMKESRLDRQPENTNPLLITEFKFTMQRIPTVTYFCQSANIPSVSVGNVEQNTMFSPINLPGVFRFEDLSLSFGVDETMKNWSTSNAEDFAEFETQDQHLSDATLVITNSAMKGKLVANFRDCFPKSLSGIDFNSAVSDPEPIIATTTFGFTTYSIERIDS